jgi:hypothetical protein
VLRSRLFIGLVVALAVVLVLLAVAQLVLPGVAAQRVRSQLGGDGVVDSVQVRAFPAVKLLWGHADTVRVRLASLRADNRRAADLLSSTSGASSLDVAIGRLVDGPLVLRDVRLAKRGSGVSGQAVVQASDLRAALPAGLDVQPVASGGGRLLLRARTGLFGVNVTVDALLGARNGALVVEPEVPFGGLATLTVFSDPRVTVQGVGAAPAPGGYTFTAQGRLRG